MTTIANASGGENTAPLGTVKIPLSGSQYGQLNNLFNGAPTQGDIAYFNGTRWTRLGKSTAGKVLRTEGASANPTWGYPADLTIASAAQGDVLYYSGSAWVRLAAGTSGFYLKTQGPAANPIWALSPTWD